MPQNHDVASKRRAHRCLECNIQFAWPYELDNHRRRRHPDESFEAVPPPPETIVRLHYLRADRIPTIGDAEFAELLRAA